MKEQAVREVTVQGHCYLLFADGRKELKSMPRERYNQLLRSMHDHWVKPWGQRYVPLAEVREWLSPPIVWINEQENARVKAASQRY